MKYFQDEMVVFYHEQQKELHLEIVGHTLIRLVPLNSLRREFFCFIV